MFQLQPNAGNQPINVLIASAVVISILSGCATPLTVTQQTFTPVREVSAAHDRSARNLIALRPSNHQSPSARWRTTSEPQAASDSQAAGKSQTASKSPAAERDSTPSGAANSSSQLLVSSPADANLRGGSVLTQRLVAERQAIARQAIARQASRRRSFLRSALPSPSRLFAFNAGPVPQRLEPYVVRAASPDGDRNGRNLLGHTPPGGLLMDAGETGETAGDLFSGFDSAPYEPGADDGTISQETRPATVFETRPSDELQEGFLADTSATFRHGKFGPIAGSSLSTRFARIVEDQRNFYTLDNALNYGVGLGVAGIFANTNIDSYIAVKYQDDVRSRDTDRFADSFRDLGVGEFVIPAYGAAWFAGEVLREYEFGEGIHAWSGRTMRGLIAGTPTLLITQVVLGPTRPDAADPSSRWGAVNGGVVGASGHTFMAAVPFLVAAEMTDNPWLKSGFLFASTFGGFSRFNDDRHYTSQVILGWYIAYLASKSVSETEGSSRFRVIPMFMPGGSGVGVEYKY